jgi:hypothetical protein
MRRAPDWDADDWRLALALNGEHPDPLSLPEPPIESDELPDDEFAWEPFETEYIDDDETEDEEDDAFEVNYWRHRRRGWED